MSTSRRPTTPTLNRPTTDERGQLLGELLAPHPELNGLPADSDLEPEA